MKEIDFPETDFNICWRFDDPDPDRYASYETTRCADEQVFVDLFNVLTILARHELLFVTHLRDVDAQHDISVALPADPAAAVAKLRELMNSQILTYEVTELSGFGHVRMPDGEVVRSPNVVRIMGFRMFERSLCISTYKSLWVPICIDRTYDYDWQIELATANGLRLTECLGELHATLKADVCPGPREVDRNDIIWAAGFELFVSPSFLLRQMQENPPSSDLDLDRFLYKEPVR